MKFTANPSGYIGFTAGAAVMGAISIVIIATNPRPAQVPVLGVSPKIYIIASCTYDESGIRSGEPVAISQTVNGKCSLAQSHMLTVGVAMESAEPGGHGAILMEDKWIIGRRR